MKVWDKRWIRFRIHVVSALLGVGMAIVLVRAFQLMVIEAGRLSAIAREDYTGKIKLPPMRGAIYDREGRELALSVQVWSIYAHPNKIKDKKGIAEKLAGILGERSDDIASLIKPDVRFAWIKRRVPSGMADAVRASGLEGVVVVAEPGRFYPGREVAAHVLGFVGRESQALEGIEKSYDELLKGEQGTLLQVRDAHARTISLFGPSRMEQGTHDLILTIDKNLQYKAQQALREAVLKRNATAGHCLVVAPDSGEILAMAVMPDFNPNSVDAFSAEQWRNRTVTDCYEPGSILKAFLLAAALEEGVVTPETTFDCENGNYSVGGSVIRDVHKYGVLTVADIMAKSSNIGCIKVGMRLGHERLVRYLKRFGFGEKASSDFVGEREGFIRVSSKARPIDQATVFFGQGLTVTSLQLAMGLSALANGGKLMKPIIVKKIINEHGEVIQENHPHVVRRVITSRTSEEVTRILERVVSKEGTAPLAAIEGFRVAGKTGTAQKVDPVTKRYSDRKHVAVFGGYILTESARLVILVVIDEPRGVSYGGVVSAPVFREVGKWSLNNLGIYPVNASGVTSLPGPSMMDKQAATPERSMVAELAMEIKSGTVPDFRALPIREVISKAYALGLKTVLEGTGFAVAQEPEPGTDLRDVASVKVSFSPPPEFTSQGPSSRQK
ncbi:MAG: PASTA domain-containing protein [Desulfobacteraceae bacterium]|nr:MAG: PASTA domain-containing protein [Desulfobacteraceae bacterium]